jgi:hypothetical protein
MRSVNVFLPKVYNCASATIYENHWPELVQILISFGIRHPPIWSDVLFLYIKKEWERNLLLLDEIGFYPLFVFIKGWNKAILMKLVSCNLFYPISWGLEHLQQSPEFSSLKHDSRGNLKISGTSKYRLLQ